MKFKFRKSFIVLVAAFVLEACSLVNYDPSAYLGNHQASSAVVLSRDFSHWRLPVQPFQQTQGSATNVSLPANTQKSGNWGGYIVTPASSDEEYSSVYGEWTIPAISAKQESAAAAQWIGLGGVSSTNLLQMGTIEQIENGQAVAKVFWEQLPYPAQFVMTVPIGSKIQASISPATGSNSTWNLTFMVNGQTPTQTIEPVTLNTSYAQGIGTSAEWISEDPSNGNDELYPLADMGTVSFSSATVNGQAINSSVNKVQPVAMLSNYGSVLIDPSELGSDGQSFSTNVISANLTSSRSSAQEGYGQSEPRRSRSTWSIITDSQGYQGGYGWSWTWTWSW